LTDAIEEIEGPPNDDVRVLKKMRLADDHEEVLGGRDLAKEIRADVVRRVEAGEEVVIDLEGVLAVSPSFADELFGKLPASVGDRVQFANASRHLQSVAAMARAGRPDNSTSDYA
jgi:uncharacterized protein DUF4325